MSIRQLRSSVAGLAIANVVAFAVAPAVAEDQSTAVTAQGEPAADQSTGLTEIIVTAQSDDRWSLAGFVDSIENDRIVTTANIDEAVNAGYVITTPPRTYGLRGAVRF